VTEVIYRSMALSYEEDDGARAAALEDDDLRAADVCHP
jgi:hypothetical protein